MKRSLFLLMAVLATCILLNSCSTKKSSETAAQSDTTRWAAMDAYHNVMAEVYHPFRDNKDLAPLRKFAENLAGEADAWAAATLPAKVNTGEVKEMIAKLKTDTHKLADLVKSGAPDEQLGTGLASLHERFHALMEAWNVEHGENEHSEKDEEH